jgi:3-keto-L-gulonate-6-phosphate decarboxylase
MAKKTKTKSEKKTFVLLDAKNKDTNHVFASRQARASALKVAVSGVKDIRLRERGTQKVHIFKGEVKMVEVDPTKIPTWLVKSLKGNKLKKAFVSKQGTEYIK